MSEGPRRAALRYYGVFRLEFPRASRWTGGLNAPSSSRRHQAPLARFVGMSVNQYCDITVLTIEGGLPLNGSARNNDSTLALPSSRRCSVRTTHGFCSHGASDANHKFQSKRGW